MRNILRTLVWGILLCSCANSFEHDPKLAAKRAEEFARVTFVNREFEKGYAMLSDSGKRYVALEKFKETVLKLHPKGFPSKVSATDYEPMAGEKAIYIYLTGENAGEHFYYTLTVDGTATTDYKVVRFSRGNSAYDSRQPLK